MQIKEMLLGLPVLFFVVWTLIAPTPQDRIARGCEPINWLGNIATSTTALANSQESTGTTARWSDKLNYSCRYMVWRLLYQDAYLRAVKEGRVPAGEASAPAASASAPVTQQSAPAAKSAKEPRK